MDAKVIRWSTILGIVSLIGVAVLISCGFRAAFISLEAERTLHAYRLVLRATAIHVEQNDGRWPASWDELAAVKLDYEPAIFAWPGDIAAIKKRVHVRFDLTAKDILSMGVENFTAITSIGPNFGPEPSLIEAILLTLAK